MDGDEFVMQTEYAGTVRVAHAQYSLDRFLNERAFIKGRLYYRHDDIEDLRAS